MATRGTPKQMYAVAYKAVNQLVFNSISSIKTALKTFLGSCIRRRDALSFKS